jgi:hypothetical protein
MIKKVLVVLTWIPMLLAFMAFTLLARAHMFVAGRPTGGRRIYPAWEMFGVIAFFDDESVRELFDKRANDSRLDTEAASTLRPEAENPRELGAHARLHLMTSLAYLNAVMCYWKLLSDEQRAQHANNYRTRNHRDNVEFLEEFPYNNRSEYPVEVLSDEFLRLEAEHKRLRDEKERSCNEVGCV